MSDAAEVLTYIYDCIKTVGDPSLSRLPEDIFGIAVRENVHCSACGKDTNQNDYVQLIHYISAVSLREWYQKKAGVSLGELLSLIDREQKKTCDTDLSKSRDWIRLELLGCF